MTEGELRERLATAMYDHLGGRKPVNTELYFECGELTDAMLAAITAAGYVIVPTDRLERLIEAATMYESDLLETCGQYTELTRQCTSVLELGDLERIGGGR